MNLVLPRTVSYCTSTKQLMYAHGKSLSVPCSLYWKEVIVACNCCSKFSCLVSGALRQELWGACRQASWFWQAGQALSNHPSWGCQGCCETTWTPFMCWSPWIFFVCQETECGDPWEGDRGWTALLFRSCSQLTGIFMGFPRVMLWEHSDKVNYCKIQSLLLVFLYKDKGSFI